MAMICSVGERLRTDQALATDVLATLDGVPLHLISRPSGGRTIAVVIDAAHARTAMSELHERFFGDLSGAAGLFPAAAEA
jgi:aspartokinase